MGRLAELHARGAVAKRLRAPVGAEHRYTVAVRGILRGVREPALAWLEPRLDQLAQKWDGPADGSPGSPLANDFKTHVETLLQDVAPKVVQPFNALSAALVKNNGKAMKKLGLDVRGQLGPHLDDFREWSQSLIKNAGRDFAANVADVLDDPDTWGLRIEEIQALLRDRAGVSDSRAKTIARDQTSKLNSSINSFRQRSAGVKSYEWSTSRDERVRDSHADNEGKEFDWGNPPSETGDPGDDVNCRCVAVPVIPELEDEAEVPMSAAAED